MTDHNRSITFTMDGGKKGNPNLLITVIERDDGTLNFSYLVDGKSELWGLYFDFNRSDLIKSLIATGLQITDQQFLDDSVTNLHQGNNINGLGHKFDAGLSFGTPGRGRDLTAQGDFTLSSGDGTPLTLDDIANVQFGARLSSNNLKLVDFAPAAPDAIDDTIVTNEDSATDENSPNHNLLRNDTDADGDQLTIVAVNGNTELVGNQFTLATGGLLTVNSDGTFDLDPNGAYEDLAVGETRTDSFTYRITDELIDANNQGFDTATASIIITGLNDAPIISIESGDSAAETVIETNGNLVTSGTLTVHDADLTDLVTAAVLSVSTSGVDGDPSLPENSALKSMLSLTPAAPAVLLDESENTDTLNWSFNSSGEAFNYLADGESLTLTYTIRAQDDNDALDDQAVTVTVQGTNDCPVASDITASVSEDAASVIGNFIASDLDSSDILSFQILSQPMDAQGHQYGEVINNNNGSFTFKPLDNFQFLESGESRDVTFQYVAIDDSGTATDTSAARTATITVNGAYDAPIDIGKQLLFESADQSMWQSGDAFNIDWREFYGLSWNESFSKTLLNSSSVELIPAIHNPWPFSGNLYDGLTITTPSLKIEAGTTGRVGISPYFELNSGSVDSNIPVDVDLTYEVQYENGDTVNISTGYTVADEAYFNTFSPSITFGLDLVFEFSAYGDLKIGSSSAGSSKSIALFPDINVNIDEAEPVAGYPSSGNGTTSNLIEFSSINGPSSDIFDIPFGDNGEYIIPIFDESSLNLSFPYIETTGSLTDSNRLLSTGSDDVAILNLDLDEILSQSKYIPAMHYEGEERLDFTCDLPGAVNALGWDDININIFDAEWDFELIDVDLLGTLTAVQDFTLDIKELPLMLTLENGDILHGFTLGSEIKFNLPDWDVDSLGNADGKMDYTLDIDLEAIFNNWTTLDFSLDLLARAFKANFEFDSIITDNKVINLFGDAGSEYFAFADNFNLLDVSPIAELFGDQDPNISGFGLQGWNTATYHNTIDIA